MFDLILFFLLFYIFFLKADIGGIALLELNAGTYEFIVQYKTDIGMPNTPTKTYRLKSLQIAKINGTILIQRRLNTDFAFSDDNTPDVMLPYPSQFGTYMFTFTKSTTIMFIHNYVGPMGNTIGHHKTMVQDFF